MPLRADDQFGYQQPRSPPTKFRTSANFPTLKKKIRSILSLGNDILLIIRMFNHTTGKTFRSIMIPKITPV